MCVIAGIGLNCSMNPGFSGYSSHSLSSGTEQNFSYRPRAFANLLNMKNRKNYRTRRLVLRPLRATDHKRWCQAVDSSFPKQNKFDLDKTLPKWKEKKAFLRALRVQRNGAEGDKFYIWNIFLQSTGELIGWVDLSTLIRDPHQMANLGYFIFNQYRGKGYATEAVRRLVKTGFRDLKFHRIEAVIDLDNKASIALAKAAGLYKEGIKKHYWFQNNRWEDQVVFIAVPELFK